MDVAHPVQTFKQLYMMVGRLLGFDAWLGLGPDPGTWVFRVVHEMLVALVMCEFRVEEICFYDQTEPGHVYLVISAFQQCLCSCPDRY